VEIKDVMEISVVSATFMYGIISFSKIRAGDYTRCKLFFPSDRAMTILGLAQYPPLWNILAIEIFSMALDFGNKTLRSDRFGTSLRERQLKLAIHAHPRGPKSTLMESCYHHHICNPEHHRGTYRNG